VVEPVPPREAARSRRILRNVTLFGIGAFGLFLSQLLCIPTAVFDGIWVPECPSGDMRQTVTLEYEDLQREKMGVVKMRVNAHYTLDRADDILSTFIRLYRTELLLVYPDGEKTTELEVDRWNLYAGVQAGNVRLPRVPDGEYTLRAIVRSAIDEQTVDVSLPLFSPSRIHLLTDRPLYEPGNTVQFRSVILRASDMRPLPFRPGKWIVTDQAGVTLLEEAVQTDEWGVAAGSFPIDRLAESGQWTVTFESGAERQAHAFQVEPFTLPRFTVETTPSAPFYVRGDTPTVRGQVSYSSGAPVSSATVEISWSSSGAWPLPTSWMQGALPRTAETDASGAFSLSIPTIPADLRGMATLRGRVQAIDPAGDRVTGTISLLLSETPILAEAVTEMPDGGLLENANNRLFLRVTTPHGVPVPDTDILVQRAWDASDEGKPARTDADGVALLQIDPGTPVNVVIPAQPVRPPPPNKPVRLSSARDLLQNREASLAERLQMDSWIAPLERCARYVVSSSENVRLGLSVAPDGRIESTTAAGTPLDRCVAGFVGRQRLPAGGQRMMRLSYRVDDPELPTLAFNVTAARQEPSGLRTVLNEAVLDARTCLPEDSADTSLPRALLWSSRSDSDQLSLRWDRKVDSTRLSAATVRCVEQRLLQVRALPEAVEQATMGVIRMSVSEASRIRQVRPQPTVMLGYELAVSIPATDGPDAETLLRMSPSTPPALRIRANPTIAAAGQEVSFEFIRGQSFSGEWPESVTLNPQKGEPIEADFQASERTASFTLPEDAEGWYTLSWGGTSSRVFVPDPDSLELTLSTSLDSYRPGDNVTIDVKTSEPASVGLFGVDQSLAQLAPLPGADHMADSLIVAPDAAPVFTGIDSQALVMGRIQGDNAAQAMVMRINSLPTLPERERPVSGSYVSYFDPIEDLTDSFYTILSELYAQTRQWERETPAEENMTNETMAALWDKAVDACEERGEPATDAYRRPLKLRWLPYDMLALTDPAMVVQDSTRLPEDIENWSAWVQEETR
jgi:hypothetical protein